MATGKQRQPNFTAQECLYLAELMGEEYAKFRMSRHKVDKHRFNSMITSASKREMWLLIEEQFNANSLTCRRSANELQKKWEIAKHRAIYADHKRHLNMTGSAPIDTKYSLLTEAVLEVIGKDSATVSGLGSEFLDTTFRQISNSKSVTVSDDEQHIMSTPLLASRWRLNLYVCPIYGCHNIWKTSNVEEALFI